MRLSSTGPIFTILDGETESNIVTVHIIRARGLCIGAPATAIGTLTVEVSFDDGETFFTLRSGGADVNLAVGKATPLDFVGWTAMRLSSTLEQTSDQVFPTGLVEET